MLRATMGKFIPMEPIRFIIIENKRNIVVGLRTVEIYLLSICTGFFMDGCGDYSGDEINRLSVIREISAKENVIVSVPQSNPCGEKQFYRIKNGGCLPLEHPEWGFQEFKIPDKNLFNLSQCTQKAFEDLLRSVPPEGGKIKLPECTLGLKEGIDIPSNIVLEGAGIGKTIIKNSGTSCVLRLIGENNIIRYLSIDGSGTSLNGVDGWKFKGNALVEHIQSGHFRRNQGSGIAFLTKEPLENSRITVRFNETYDGLHGIDIKVHTDAKVLIYSNNSYKNANYGIDMSSNKHIEVAGNYLHNNEVAGAKSPKADYIIYHHNDINRNVKAGLVYMASNTGATIVVQNNDLSNNGGQAFAVWNGRLKTLRFMDNNVSGSVDPNGFSMGVVGVDRVEVRGDHGRVWPENASVIYY